MAKVEVLERELAALRQQIEEAKPVGVVKDCGFSHMNGPDQLLYSTPQPCPKCAKAVEALKVFLDTDDYAIYNIAREALAELEK